MDMVLGMSISELAEIREKLAIAGVELSDIKEFLDRDKTQLFAEMKAEIRHLNEKLKAVREASA